MDKIIAIFTELPEKSFRVLVLVALAALLGFAAKTQIDVAMLKATSIYFHGEKK